MTANLTDSLEIPCRVMPAHLDLLQSGNKDIRVAAGENIALMFECVNVTKRMVSRYIMKMMS